MLLLNNRVSKQTEKPITFEVVVFLLCKKIVDKIVGTKAMLAQ